MYVPIAFVAVILVWSTTPLGVKWSAEGITPFAGAFFRIFIAAMAAWVVCKAMRLPILWHKKALLVYAAADIGWVVGLLCVYNAATMLSSGMISVLFGSSPIISGLLARYLLDEPPFSLVQWAGLLVGVMGLSVIFESELQLPGASLKGLMFVGVGVLCFCLSGVLIKRIDAGLHPISQTAGTLLTAAPLYALMLVFAGGDLLSTETVSARAVGAIVYLALFGSLLGFFSYFYILQKLPPSTVALTTLVTPVLALVLGALLNNEVASESLLLGASCIVAGLAFYLMGPKLVAGWLRA